VRVYQDLLSDVLYNGVRKEDRTGTGTLSVFGRQARFSLTSMQMPLCTTKKLHWKSIVHELLWMISGSTNIKYLNDNGVSIWNEWADEDGELGPVYGKQWRRWKGETIMDGKGGHYVDMFDQLGGVIGDLKTNPDSRRHIVSAWNVGDVDAMSLPPCHLMYQFYATWDQNAVLEARKRRLSCMMTIRSCDLFLGAPFNIASYALLTHMVAQVVGMEAHELIVNFGDLHLYSNHLEQARIQILRRPKKLPRIKLNPAVEHIDSFVFEDVELIGYSPHPPISAQVSV